MTVQVQTGGSPVLLLHHEFAARCAIHPRYTSAELFEAGLFELKKVKSTSTYVSSVGWRKHLPKTNDVHAYGCRTAATSNERRLDKGVELKPLENQAHYLGFYEFSVADAVNESNEVYSVSVEHFPEDGEVAHCHLTLTERLDLGKDLQRLKSTYRTHVLTGLWENACRGPETHICDCDKEFTELASKKLPARTQIHPSSKNLGKNFMSFWGAFASLLFTSLKK